MPDRGYPILQGTSCPQGGNPGSFFGLKLDLEFNGPIPKS